MLDVEDDQRGGDDLPDPPRVEADVAQCSEAHLEQGVSALADRAQAVVGFVELLLDQEQPAVLRSLERDGDRIGEAVVAQIAEGAQVCTGVGEGGQDLGVGACGGGVVFAAGPYVGGPDRPSRPVR